MNKRQMKKQVTKKSNHTSSKISMRELQKLPLSERSREYSKLAKRANQRIRDLEKNGLLNESPAVEKLGVFGEHFKQTYKFKNKTELNNNLRIVTTFLNDSTSTTGGTKQYMIKEANKIDVKNMNIRDLSIERRKELIQILGKRANQRMKALEDNDMTRNAYAIADKYLSKQKNNKKRDKNRRFYTGSKFNSVQEMNRHLAQITLFLNYKSSTVAGNKKIMDERVQAFNQRFRERGINFQITAENHDAFFTFIASDQYKGGKFMIDSNQFFDDIARGFMAGQTPEQMHEEYAKFLNDTYKTFEQVDEARQKAVKKGMFK